MYHSHDSNFSIIVPQRVYCVNGFQEKHSVNMIPNLDDASGDISAIFPGYTEAHMLRDRLHNTMLVTALMISPLCSVTNLPDIAVSPILRTIALFACILDLTGFLTASVFCLRLWHMRAGGQDEVLHRYCHCHVQKRTLELIKNQDLCNTWSGRMLSTMSPMVLIASSMLLLLITLSGPLFTRNANQIQVVPFGTLELTVLCIACCSAIVHLGFVFRTIAMAGKPDQIPDIAPHQKPTSRRHLSRFPVI
ncbi:uncharacterized protein PHACADRAFT_252621 [Phanerochaete carnosa HHB-10118-sp]|uniref:Uncharacterized protein n=1 Tax=Phanerochaete carnosa (strain HHB-10118-sp) TaxID=650164 RepID=K5V6N4_PHACS|nr:uncharacterized protein PHACADRAFT_252621 [Phanerochaete carnosa HHB-10118-sp]EKM58361.1 hypothetical protein PHACADRAFT_252621 [Phanerochaete carnosa HHB-10118-sp]